MLGLEAESKVGKIRFIVAPYHMILLPLLKICCTLLTLFSKNFGSEFPNPVTQQLRSADTTAICVPKRPFTVYGAELSLHCGLNSRVEATKSCC